MENYINSYRMEITYMFNVYHIVLGLKLNYVNL